MSKVRFTRRQVIESFGVLMAGSSALSGQQLSKEHPPARIPPRQELVNILEFEDVSKSKLPSTAYSTIAGGDRRAFDRMTFRPRMMVNTTNLDLTVELFGEKMFAPILVGPIGDQKRFHPDGELATVQGASAAKTVMVVSGRSSHAIDELAAQAKTSLWYQVFSERDHHVREQVQRAVKAGCKAVCITVGGADPIGNERSSRPLRLPDWSVVDQIRQAVDLPVLVKGIMSPQDAKTAVQRGIQGLIVSNNGGHLTGGSAAPIVVLPSIVDAVGKNVTVLIDGGFRRGSDIVKALALGAQAVLLGRPVMWGLSAYGAEGVQTVLEMLQTEVGRVMAGCGKPNLKTLDRSLVKIHER